MSKRKLYLKDCLSSGSDAVRNGVGKNIIPPPEKDPWWKLYLEKFKDPVIKVLLFAAVLSLGISIIENEYAETIGIIFAILLATSISYHLDRKNERLSH